MRQDIVATQELNNRVARIEVRQNLGHVFCDRSLLLLQDLNARTARVEARLRTVLEDLVSSPDDSSD